MTTIPIGDPRLAGEAGPAGDQRAAGEDGPAGDPRKASETSTVTTVRFDPSEHTVAEVNDYLDSASDAERQRVVVAEKAGKNRASITG